MRNPSLPAPTEGSSPLARGLRFWSPHRGGVIRIIPARAGFTRSSTCGATATQDHPRSRGVYFPAVCVDQVLNGSSPLARGLPVTARCVRVDRGIIPARAGFTSLFLPVVRPPMDHPRSRGVYEKLPITTIAEWGSSPLARGLQSFSLPLASGRRIIPARAGFTRPTTRTPFGRGDHPRSRGVYLVLRLSPVDAERIIPARAGFTAGGACTAVTTWDHPRSRGVYAHDIAIMSDAEGSSPLARGLRRRFNDPKWAAGIIPARAGFTGPRRGPGGP